MAVSDEELCRQIAQRDRAAFENLVERHQERTYRLAWSILKNPDDARDLSQDAFVKLFQVATSFDGRSRFSTWFYRIVVNLCLDHRRKGQGWRRLLSWSEPGDKSEPVDMTEFPSWEMGPEEEAGVRERADRLWRAADRLPDKQRAALVLSIQEGLNSAEIGAVLNCSEATVRVHLHRAMRELKKTVGSV